METLKESRKMNTLTFRVPAGSQTTFLRTMARNMGWEAVPMPRKRKRNDDSDEFTPNSCTIRAMQDVRAGKVFRASSAEDLINQILG